MSQAGGSDPKWQSWLKTFADFAQVLGVLGIAFYAIGRYSAERFYRHFGLTPEDVGQTYATLVWPAAVAAALYSCTLFGVSWSVKRIIVPKERSPASKKYWLVLIPLLLIYALIIYVILLRSIRENSPLSAETVFWYCVWYGTLWGAVRGIVHLERLRAKEAKEQDLREIAEAEQLRAKGQDKERYRGTDPDRLRANVEHHYAQVEKQLRWRLVLFIIPFVVLPLFNGAVLTTLDYGDLVFKTVDRGLDANFDYPTGSNISAQRVQVLRRDDKPLPIGVQGTCLHLLGTAGGVTFLYDHLENRVWRIPTADLMLRQPCFKYCSLANSTQLAHLKTRMDVKVRDKIKKAWLIPSKDEFAAMTKDGGVVKLTKYFLGAEVPSSRATGQSQIAVWQAIDKVDKLEDRPVFEAYNDMAERVSSWPRSVDVEASLGALDNLSYCAEQG
jgi:hypothetical protein